MTSPINLVPAPTSENARVIETLEKALERAKKGDIRQAVVVIEGLDEIHTWWAGSELRLVALTSRAEHILHRRADEEMGITPNRSG